jgi:hypothetical protein
MAYTPVFTQGVKFIKIARVDEQGKDNTLSLQELNSIRIDYSDTGIIEYPITSISKYDTYFLFGILPTNQTSSADNQILNYRFSSSYKRTLGNSEDFTLNDYATYGSVAYDTLNNFTSASGLYAFENLTNIPVKLTLTSSVTSSGNLSGAVVVYISSSLRGYLASDNWGIPVSPSFPNRLLSASYTGVLLDGENIGISFTNTSNNSIYFTSSFFTTQSIAPNVSSSDLVVLQPYIDEDFLASDYNVLAGDVFEPRVNPFYMDVDYASNAIQAVNFDQIISGSATRATVQQSNYTYASHIGGRYVGQQLNGIDINTYTPATEYTGSTTGSVATGSFVLNGILGDEIPSDAIQINFSSNQYTFVASGSIGDIPADVPPLYYFPIQLSTSATVTAAATKINGALSGSTATSQNLLKAAAAGTTLNFTSSFTGSLYNNITVFTGSYAAPGSYPFVGVTILQGGTNSTENTSIYGFTGSWPGDISYGKSPIIRLFDSCIYEFSDAISGYPVIENGGTINLNNIYLIGETVDSVNTIDYVDPSYETLIQRNLPIGTSIYQQQYVNANLLPTQLEVALNGIGVNESSYFIPSSYTSSYSDSMVVYYNVPGLIYFYGSGSTNDPTFNVPFVDFQFSGDQVINPKILTIPVTSINSSGFQQTGSLVGSNNIGTTISSSLSEGNKWFISFYTGLGNIANGNGLGQLGLPVEIDQSLLAYNDPSTQDFGHWNLILKISTSDLLDQLNTTAPIGSIGGRGTAAVTGSGYGVLIWQGNQAPNLITNVGSTSNLYNDITAGYILLDPVKPLIKNNINYITKKYGKNA